MTANTHVGMTRTVATPVEVGVKHIRWGLGLFIFGLVIGYVPLAHYMHGSFEQVGEAHAPPLGLHDPAHVCFWHEADIRVRLHTSQLLALSGLT